MVKARLSHDKQAFELCLGLLGQSPLKEAEQVSSDELGRDARSLRTWFGQLPRLYRFARAEATILIHQGLHRLELPVDFLIGHWAVTAVRAETDLVDFLTGEVHPVQMLDQRLKRIVVRAQTETERVEADKPAKLDRL